jgi:hypothetical protein
LVLFFQKTVNHTALVLTNTSIAQQLFEFTRNHQFWFLNYFRMREPWIPVFWKKIRIKEPSVPLISKTLKNSQFSWKNQHWACSFLAGYFKIFKILRTTIIYQNWIYDYLATHGYESYKRSDNQWASVPVFNNRPTLVLTVGLQ